MNASQVGGKRMEFLLDHDAAHLHLRLLNGNKPIDDVNWQFTYFDEKKGSMKGERWLDSKIGAVL